MSALVALAVAMAVLLPGAVAAGPIHADATVYAFFRLQW